MGKVHLDDLNFENRPYKALDAYNDSKLDIILFSLELQRRLTAEGSPVRSMIAHPGIASTKLEVVPGLVEVEVAVPRLTPALR